jgi:HlyD family secretion protein
MLLRTASVDAQAAEFAVTIAEFELQLAQAALRQTTTSNDAHENRLMIHSSMSGEVPKVFQQSAGLLPAGSSLVELGDRTEMQCPAPFFAIRAAGRLIRW